MTIGPSFSGVLDAARTGADWAWTTLYRDLAPNVLGYLRAHGCPDAEDATSEVFVSVVRNLASFSGDEGEFRSWVFVIAHRRMLDERRRLTRHPVGPSDQIDDLAGPGVEDEAVTSLATREIREMIDELSPDQRDVLLLRIIGGLTVDEIATVIGKRSGAVKALQRRGLAQLAKLIPREAVPLS